MGRRSVQVPHGGEPALEVGEDVVDMLQSDRQTDGAGADAIHGIMDNTELSHRIMQLLDLEEK